MNTLHKFYSHKNRSLVPCDSLMETHAALLYEFDENIVCYTAQPFSIMYSIDGRNRRYTPDFLIQFSNSEFKSVEVKPLNKLLREDDQKKFSILRSHFIDNLSHPLILLDDKSIYQGNIIENLQRLYPYLQQNVESEEVSIISLLNSHPITFEELVNKLAKHVKMPVQSALKILAHGYLEWDKSRLIDCNTPLHIKGGIS